MAKARSVSIPFDSQRNAVEHDDRDRFRVQLEPRSMAEFDIPPNAVNPTSQVVTVEGNLFLVVCWIELTPEELSEARVAQARRGMLG